MANRTRRRSAAAKPSQPDSPSAIRSGSAKYRLLAAKQKAKREGWAKWLRVGPGEEADERALLHGCWFDPRKADHFVDYVDEFCCLTEGAFAGKPFRLTDWQAACASRVMGWQKQHPEWGHPVRRFRFWYEEVPKKNGKTPFAAAIGNYLLTADAYGRQVNVTYAATTKKQAERCLKHSVRMVAANEELAASCVSRKLDGYLSLAYGENEANVVAADPASSDGVNGHCIADELHRWKGFEFFNALRWMLASQPEGLFVGITTAGSDLQGVCRSLHDYTKSVNAGRIVDDSWFGEIFAAGPEDDPHDEATWFKANPSLGTGPDAPLKLSTFREDYEQAKNDPSQWQTWLQLRLNVWRSAESTWLPIEVWDAGSAARAAKRKRIDCAEEYTLDDLAGCECDAGLDVAAVRDTASCVLAFPTETDAGDPIVRVWPMFWLPRARAEELGPRVPFAQWADRGMIHLTDGDAVDFNAILNDILAVFARVKVRRLFFDPLFQAEWLTQRIEDESGAERVEFPQTIVSYTPPTKLVEQLIWQQRLRHPGHPILTWQFGHTRIKTDANQNKRPVKQKHGDYRTIDGVVAMIMSVAQIFDEDSGRTVYDDDDQDVEFL